MLAVALRENQKTIPRTTRATRTELVMKPNTPPSCINSIALALTLASTGEVEKRADVNSIERDGPELAGFVFSRRRERGKTYL